VITLIGATTENPSFSVIGPLLSRCRVFTLRALDAGSLAELVGRGVERLNADRREGECTVALGEGAAAALVALSDGDARRCLGLLEVVASVRRAEAAGGEALITAEEIATIAQRHFVYDKSGEEHFNLISALHKTLRSSDPHAAIYWLERMMASGEDPRYIARRLVRFASEDIGLADPNALGIALDGLRAYESLGLPEGALALYQVVIYLAMAPKSNAIYRAQKAVQEEVARSGSLPVPMHLRNAPTGLMKELGYGAGYTYDHDAAGHFSPKPGLPAGLEGRRFYAPTQQGKEGAFARRLEELDRLREEGGDQSSGSGRSA
jgi:putative ATPase